jgi:hypothetical protein
MYELFISDSGSDIHAVRVIKNSTLQTYGKNNIIDKIKDFIDVVLKEPYTHKIKILDVHVNREIYQPKQYRYLGGVIRIDRKKKQEYIQYFKAWNHN